MQKHLALGEEFLTARVTDIVTYTTASNGCLISRDTTTLLKAFHTAGVSPLPAVLLSFLQ